MYSAKAALPEHITRSPGLKPGACAPTSATLAGRLYAGNRSGAAERPMPVGRPP